MPIAVVSAAAAGGRSRLELGAGKQSKIAQDRGERARGVQTKWHTRFSADRTTKAEP